MMGTKTPVYRRTNSDSQGALRGAQGHRKSAKRPLRQQDATFLAGGQRLCDEGCPCPRGLGGTRGNRGLLGRDAVTVMKTGESQQNPDTMLILAFFLWETIWRQNE